MKNKNSMNVTNQKNEIDTNNFHLEFCSSPQNSDKSWIKEAPTKSVLQTRAMVEANKQKLSSMLKEIKPCSLPQIPMQITLQKPHTINRWYTKIWGHFTSIVLRM